MCSSNPDEYRFRCPRGHVTIRRHTKKPTACNIPHDTRGVIPEPSYYCNTCKKRYEGKPIDMLEWNNAN